MDGWLRVCNGQLPQPGLSTVLWELEVPQQGVVQAFCTFASPWRDAACFRVTAAE